MVMQQEDSDGYDWRGRSREGPQTKDPGWLLHTPSLSHVQLLAIPWTVAHQIPLSMGFFRQEYWSGLPLPSPGNLLTQGLNLGVFFLDWRRDSRGTMGITGFLLCWPWEAQSSPRVARESWGWRSSHCRAEETSPKRVSGT